MLTPHCLKGKPARQTHTNTLVICPGFFPWVPLVTLTRDSLIRERESGGKGLINHIELPSRGSFENRSIDGTGVPPVELLESVLLIVENSKLKMQFVIQRHFFVTFSLLLLMVPYLHYLFPPLLKRNSLEI